MQSAGISTSKVTSGTGLEVERQSTGKVQTIGPLDSFHVTSKKRVSARFSGSLLSTGQVAINNTPRCVRLSPINLQTEFGGQLWSPIVNRSFSWVQFVFYNLRRHARSFFLEVTETSFFLSRSTGVSVEVFQPTKSQLPLDRSYCRLFRELIHMTL